MRSPVSEPGVTGAGSDPESGNRETFGHSVEGRPLVVHYCGDPAARLRIFILAGQHGDEGDARDAAADFLAAFRNDSFRAPVRLAVVTNANPDGAVAGTRRNALDINLNRDHLILDAPETLAVHALIDRWRPDLILDVHTYRPWRKEVVPWGLVYPQDIMMDFTTNPAVRTFMGPAHQRSALEFVKSRLAETAVRAERYTLVRHGIVRHSNPDIIDARNALALRFDSPVVLIEGRRASPDDSLAFTHPAVALLRAIEAFVDWTVANARSVGRRPSRFPALVPVRCRYAGPKKSCYMEMQSLDKGGICRVRMPGRYLPRIEVTGTVTMPGAYAVPRDLDAVLDVLARHRFETAHPGHFPSAETESWRIESVTATGEPDAPVLPVCRLRRISADLDDFVLFPTRQPGGRLLALMLEPESQFGPHRFIDLAESLQPGAHYPIIRVV